MKTTRFQILHDNSRQEAIWIAVNPVSVSSVEPLGYEYEVIVDDGKRPATPEWNSDLTTEENDAARKPLRKWREANARTVPICRLETWGTREIRVLGTLDEVCAKLGWTR